MALAVGERSITLLGFFHEPGWSFRPCPASGRREACGRR
jgi:hypothetical protein